MLARAARRLCSSGWRLTRTTPTTADTIPTNWIDAGRLPAAIPTITGRTTPLAVIGATMLICPIDRAL